MLRRVIARTTPFCAWVLLFSAFRVAHADMLCAREEVAQVVAREMRDRNQYARLDRASVLEWATGDPGTVRCTALALVEAPYPPARVGGASYRELYRYTVTVSSRRFTVRFAN